MKFDKRKKKNQDKTLTLAKAADCRVSPIAKWSHKPENFA